MTWQKQLKENITRIDDLASFLQLSYDDREKLIVKRLFPLNIPLRLAQKIKKGTLNDPILRQYVPIDEELKVLPGYQSDPVSDQTFQITEKLLRKYHGRVLLLSTGACAMHCRFCFRQNYPYQSSNAGFAEELNWIKKHPEIYEIILSGGDPLSLSDRRLETLLMNISAISHIKFLRFHTRFLLGIPERINDSFVSIIRHIPQKIYIILHINHPRELDKDVEAALKTIRQAGAEVLSQTVLLNQINDRTSILYDLFFRLAQIGVKPYYLHQFDRVQGGHHFEVDRGKGKLLIEELSALLPGYAVPKYVEEIPGRKSKTPV